jgi:hypothetical protein
MVDIYQRLKGAKHCGLEHEPDKHETCDKCGQPLQHKEVFTIWINGHEISGLDLKDKNQAATLAIKFVDHLLTEGDADLKDQKQDEDDEEGDARDEDDEEDPPESDPAKKDSDESEEDEDEDDQDEDQAIDKPADEQPNRPTNAPPGANRFNPNIGDIAGQMEKLGWFERAVTMVKARKERQPKKRKKD